MKRPTQQDSHRFCLPLKGSKVPSPLLCCLGGHQGAIRVPFPFPSWQVLQGPLAYKVPEAGLGQPARIQGSVPWTSSGH